MTTESDRKESGTAREFWIDKSSFGLIAADNKYHDAYEKLPWKDQNDFIHVIEYSTLQASQAEVERLQNQILEQGRDLIRLSAKNVKQESKFKLAVEALEYISKSIVNPTSMTDARYWLGLIERTADKALTEIDKG